MCAERGHGGGLRRRFAIQLLHPSVPLPLGLKRYQRLGAQSGFKEIPDGGDHKHCTTALTDAASTPACPHCVFVQMHIVNKRKDLTLDEALETPNGLAVLGFFIEVTFSAFVPLLWRNSVAGNLFV